MAIGLKRRRTLVNGNGAGPGKQEPLVANVRLGKRTKKLTPKLLPGEIAIIDHADLDRVAAEDLVASGVVAVVNVSPSSTGRYPNAGPLVVARGGAWLVDTTVPLFDQLRDGDQLTITPSGELRLDGNLLGTGHVWSIAELEQQREKQRRDISGALAAFAENTIEHVREEGALLSGDIDYPATRTDFRDRHVLIVVRGRSYREDLRALRAYIDDVRPVLVGVDGGADALVELGLKPDMIVGDMDSASDEVLTSGAEIVVHAYADGRAPGRKRLDELGVEPLLIPAVGTSQDIAMLLAHDKGARLIVSVGAQFNLVEFLDKNRAGMASTFLTRLRVGEILVDAKGVSRLYRPSPSLPLMFLCLAGALVAIVVVALTSERLASLFELIWLKIQVALGI